MAKTKGPNTVQEATRQLRKVEREGAFYLDLFGDTLSKREGYKSHGGLEALQFYLIQKHHWLPSQVKSLNWDDLHFLFAEEMHGWVVPKEFQS